MARGSIARVVGEGNVERTISPVRANLVALALTPLVVAVFFVPFGLLWGGASLQAVLDRLVSPFLLVLVVSVGVHEVLHGVGCTLVGRVPWREVRFGFKGLVVYAHCRVPMTALAYRVSVALPGLVLGVLPGLMGLIWGNGWLTVYGALMSIAALGDWIVLWLIRSVARETRVQDHPRAPGCIVYGECDE
jgi:hypothetical protein